MGLHSTVGAFMEGARLWRLGLSCTAGKAGENLAQGGGRQETPAQRPAPSCRCWESGKSRSGGSALCAQQATALSAPQQAVPPLLRRPGSYLPIQKTVENSHHKALGREDKQNLRMPARSPPPWGVWEAAGAASDTRKQKTKMI